MTHTTLAAASTVAPPTRSDVCCATSLPIRSDPSIIPTRCRTEGRTSPRHTRSGYCSADRSRAWRPGLATTTASRAMRLRYLAVPHYSIGGPYQRNAIRPNPRWTSLNLYTYHKLGWDIFYTWSPGGSTCGFFKKIYPVLLRYYSDTHPVPLRYYSGTTPVLLWYHSGTTPIVLRYYSGTIPVLFPNYFGTTSVLIQVILYYFDTTPVLYSGTISVLP